MKRAQLESSDETKGKKDVEVEQETKGQSRSFGKNLSEEEKGREKKRKKKRDKGKEKEGADEEGTEGEEGKRRGLSNKKLRKQIINGLGISISEKDKTSRRDPSPRKSKEKVIKKREKEKDRESKDVDSSTKEQADPTEEKQLSCFSLYNFFEYQKVKLIPLSVTGQRDRPNQQLPKSNLVVAQ